MDNRKNNGKVVPLTETDKVICAALIENIAWLRRVIRFSPHGDPTAELLNKLWAYATSRNKKVELANALLGCDRLKYPWEGRDFFLGCNLPQGESVFFWLLRRFGWVKCRLESDKFRKEEDAEVCIASTALRGQRFDPPFYVRHTNMYDVTPRPSASMNWSPR